jgi:Pvc16 N-terminal domain
MPNDSSIADVGETIISLLRSEMGESAPGQIALMSPVDVGDQEISITVFLYSIVETPSLRNEPPVNSKASEFQIPPLSLDLYYMLTCYGSERISDLSERTLQARELLGQAMRVLYDFGIIGGSLLQGDLAGTDEELRITLNTITVEDITRIWSVFPDTPFRPSVSYLVTPVRLASKRTTSHQRVISKQIEQGRMIPNRNIGK